MELPLRQLLKLPAFRGVTVRMGDKYLDRVISRVAFVDCPEGIIHMQGNELLVSSGYIIADRPDLQERIIRQSAAKNVSALAFTDNFFNTPNWEYVYRLCQELEIPVLAIPQNVSFNRLNAFITENYVSRTNQEIRKKLEVVIELNEALRNEGFAGAVKCLHKWTGRQVYIYSATDEFRYSYPEQAGDISNAADMLGGGPGKTLWESDIRPGVSALCGRLKRGAEAAGLICITQGGTPFTRDDRELLRAVISICENELKINSDLLTLQYEQTHKVVMDIIKERLDENTAKILSRNLGLILPEKYVVLFCEIKAGSSPELNIHLYKKFNTLRALSTMYEPERFVALCPPHLSQKDLQDVFSEISQRFPAMTYTTVVCHNVDFANIPAAVNHTRRAMKAINILKPDQSFFSTGDLGIYSLLDTEYDSLLIHRYYERYIEPLAQLPDDSLLQTLHVLSRNCYNYTKTAAEMYLHSNTIRYRASVIERMLQIDINNAEDRLELEIALRIDILYSRRRL